MDTCQNVIDAGMTFRQNLDEILTEGPSLSLSKSERLTVIKSKFYDSKNK